ncbi:MAG: hypothetical protein ACREQI_12830 [Candidatus Binataceae bacterium]
MKVQQQTLSVRISDALRRRLESARHLAGSTADEPVSISEVAKRFLETAQDDNIEASELLSRPTETLLGIRHKWERQQGVSRPEWLTLGYFLQAGCEDIWEGAEQLPTSESYADLLEAFIVARGVRSGKDPEADKTYVGNLDAEAVAQESKGAGREDSDGVVKVARNLIRRLRESSSSKPKPVFVGRNLYMVFRDEQLKGIEALNKALLPYMPALFRIAARGHYLREGRPVRERLDQVRKGFEGPQPPPVVSGDLRLSITIDATNEFSFLLDFGPRRVLYPLDSYPVIRGFAAMLAAVKPGGTWRGREFFGYADRGGESFNFRRRSNGITLTFTGEEWRTLGKLVNRALELPEMQPALEDALWAYGEI